LENDFFHLRGFFTSDHKESADFAEIWVAAIERALRESTWLIMP